LGHDGPEDAPDATREIAAGRTFNGPTEATALIDAESMEGLQASSRRGSSSIPPPSDAEPTRTLEPGKLSELVNGASIPPAPTRLDRAPPSPAVMSGRSRYTPTLQSAKLQLAPRAALWPLLAGTLFFGGGLGAFLAVGPPVAEPPAPTESVELHIRARPQVATITLDGKALSGNPARAEEKRGAARRTVTIAATGYVSQTVEVSLDSDSIVDVALEPAPSPPAPSDAPKGP